MSWKHLMVEAADAEQVRRWWQRWPDANVGVVTGRVSRLVVLDVDPRHGGGRSLEALEAVHGPLPKSVTSLTGGGGRHHYFRHPGAGVPSRPIAPGLDVKGDGGLVICPPSVHMSGRSYSWVAGHGPGEVEICDPPGWLLTIARGARRVPSRDGATVEGPGRTQRERAEFASLWASIGIAIGRGEQYYLCPFHADHHPSLHIDADGCRFYCFGCERGGGIGRLRRLIGTRRPPVPGEGSAVSEALGDLAEAEVTLRAGTPVRVVGEAAYQDALLELAGGRHYGGTHTETVARLWPEPDNPADPSAIAVKIGGRKVGYLSRSDAIGLRPAIDAALEAFGQATCLATIVGGWERAHGDIGSFGVRLTL